MWMSHSCLDCRDPGSIRYTGEPEARKVGDREIWCSYGFFFLASGSSVPVGIKCGGGTGCLDHGDPGNASYGGSPSSNFTGDTVLLGFVLTSGTSA